MGFGVSILIIAVGAILTFATNMRVKGFNLDNIGVIMMIAGAVCFVITLVIWGKGRTASVAGPTNVGPTIEPPVGPAMTRTVDDRRTYQAPPAP